MGKISSDIYKKEEAYIIDESPEISVGEAPFLNKLFRIFPALKSKNYALYFSGQLISLVGTWLQIVAQGWLVLQLTNSVFLLGVVSAISTLPTLLFSLYGGVIVDRFPKKKILLFTQSSSMALAFILGILTVLKLINVPEIMVLAFLLGIITAVDAPARQSFVPEIVGKQNLASAIALNSGAFNAARVVGPAIAGFLIAIVGTGGAFILNGISYIAVIAALFAMKVPSVVRKNNLNPMAAIKEGLSYSFSHPVIRSLLLLIAVVSIFGWSYTTIMPAIAQNVYHMGATGLGYLYSAGGLGALAGMVVVSATLRKVSPTKYIFGGNLIFAVSIFLFSLYLNFTFALIFIFFAGFGLLVQITTINSTIQSMVGDQIRGRVMSIYVLMFIGTTPIGSYQIGWLSDKFGTSFAMQLGAAIIFIFGLILFLRRKKVAEEYGYYQKANLTS
ncbi:MAG: MFS transporter [Patescibacteria group bacterium]|nr:MFS transporter [Patescibacteria group bacterium]